MSNGEYLIYGSELSPYSVKVRSYFRYKGIPHQWIVRSMQRMGEFQKYAKLPLIPLVVTPEDKGIQDSTPIIEKLEAVHPDPSIHPSDPALKFLDELLEEFADEWVNKPMFHYRWTREVDQDSAAYRIAMDQTDGQEKAAESMAPMIKQRMVPRLSFVGSSPETQEQIENAYVSLIESLEAHLAARPYVLGARPGMADFGLWGQLYELWSDPTPGALMKEKAPKLVAWVDRMLDPKAEGEFEPMDALLPTLEPILKDHVAGLFLPWSDANAKALAAGDKEFSVELSGKPFTQQTQKYHAKSLGVIRAKYEDIAESEELKQILDRTGCLPWLSRSS